MKYWTTIALMTASLYPSLGWSLNPACMGDQMLQKLDPSQSDPVVDRYLRIIADFQHGQWKQRYRSYLEPRPARDGKPAYPALLDETTGDKSIPSVLLVQKLSEKKSIPLRKEVEEVFGIHLSDSQSINLENIYYAAHGLAKMHNNGVEPTVEQIYETMRDAAPPPPPPPPFVWKGSKYIGP